MASRVSGGPTRNWLHIWHSGTLQPGSTTTATAWIRTPDLGEMGITVVAHGDFDGDGVADLLVGGSDAVIRIWFGADLTNASGELPPADVTVSGCNPSPEPGDVDGDGLDDLACLSPTDSTAGANAGAVFIVPGVAIAGGGTLSTADADIRLYGPAGWQAGLAASLGGDYDGDGINDPLVGFSNSRARVEVGRVSP